MAGPDCGENPVNTSLAPLFGQDQERWAADECIMSYNHIKSAKTFILFVWPAQDTWHGFYFNSSSLKKIAAIHALSSFRSAL